MTEAEAPSAVTVSSPDLVRAARVVRALQGALEAALWAIVAGSVLAFGSVHAWAYSILWVACFVAAAIALLRAVAVGGMRQRLGAHRVAFHVSSRWLVVEPHPADRALGWSIDLRAPALPRGPLLLPGLAFLALALLQLAPLGGGRVTLAPEATRRGITFVLAFLLLHQSAAAAFAHSPARRRFRTMLAWLGAALALVALVQLASGTRLAYGFFESLEGGLPYGPFVNRNHFAGYMLLVLPIALGLLADAWRSYARRVGEGPNARRALVGLQTREGTRLVYAALPPLLGIGALLASTSRGGILAFGAALGIAAVGVRARKGTPAWAAALVFAAVALTWFGLERLEVRFLRASDDAPGRTVVWRESLEAMHGSRWATGYGFNAYAEALSRVKAWRLPAGATPWPEAVAARLASGERLGYRAPGDLPGLAWYREAHSDWVQLLVETGVPGLLVGLWAALAALAAARRDPWLFAALAGVLMHAFVDFDLQIPAIPALFVVLAAGGASAMLSRRLPAGRDPNRHSQENPMRHAPVRPVLTLVALASAALAVAAAYEAPRAFKAAELLKPAQIKGKHHSVAPAVKTEGYLNVFDLTTDWGPLEAEGESMLLMRLHEVGAIAELDKVSQSEVFLAAAGTSMLNVGKGVASVVKDPEGTARGMGEGVKRFGTNLGRKAKRTADKAVDSATSDKPKEGEQKSTTGKAAETGVSVADSVLGVNGAARKWAQKVGADPYTTNPILKKALVDLGRIDAAGGIAAKIAVPIPMVVTGTATAGNLVWAKDPEALLKENEQKLREMGVGGDVIKQLYLSRGFTLTLHTALAGNLRQVNVPGCADYVATAAEADAEREGIFFVESAGMLARFHKQAPVAAVLPDSRALVAKTKDGRAVVLLPVDWVPWTGAFDKALTEVEKRARAEMGATKLEMRLTGTMSALAKKEMAARGWTVTENVPLLFEAAQAQAKSAPQK